MKVETQKLIGHILKPWEGERLDPGDEALFWKHLGMLIGRDYDENHRRDFVWSCSC